MTDTFLFNGDIRRVHDHHFIEMVTSEKKSDNCLLVLVTNGGDPDAAYKMARFLQSIYKNLTVVVPGLCKSAGTMLAVGANELVFFPYGELGPLDVQMTKVDNLGKLESGLNISEAFYSLEERAREAYSKTIEDILKASGGVVSFPSAAHAASEMISATFGPIFARIDPEEVGSRTRAMRIGADYCQRLNRKWGNLKNDCVDTLTSTYPSHSFIIDQLEASSLFNRVREPSNEEIELIKKLGSLARYPNSKLTIKALDPIPNKEISEVSGDEERRSKKRPAAGKSKVRKKSDGPDIARAEPAQLTETKPALERPRAA